MKTVYFVRHGGSEQMLRTVYEDRPYQTFLETEPLHNGTVREYEIGA